MMMALMPMSGFLNVKPVELAIKEATHPVGPPGAGSTNATILSTTYLSGNHSYDDLYIGCGIVAPCGSIIAAGTLTLTVNTLTVASGGSIVASKTTSTNGSGGDVSLSTSWKGDAAGGGGHQSAGGSGGGKPGSTASPSNGGSSHGSGNETGSRGGDVSDSNGNLVSDGGNAGGRVIIYADTIEIYGVINASGELGDPGYRYNNGSGTGGPGAGGGSGGSIVMRANSVTIGGSSGKSTVVAYGGNGGDGADGACLPGNPCLFMYDGGSGGGGGSGGNIDICASSSSNLVISANAIVSASGGNGGVGGAAYGTGVAGNSGYSGGAGSTPLTSTSTCSFTGWSGSSGGGGTPAPVRDWDWVTSGYSSTYTWSWDVVVNGNTSFIVGWFAGTATFGSTILTSAGERDIFVAAADSSGSWLWATSAGGSEYDYGMGIDLSPDGTLRITGYAVGPATFGNLTMGGQGNRDIFVASLDQNGTWLWLWSGGGQSHEEGVDIGVDDDGDCIVVGYQYSSTATYGSSTVNNSDDADTVILSIDANGTWQWTEVIVADFARPHSVDVAPNGSSIFVGEHGEPVTANGLTYPLNGNKGRDDAYIGALDKNGSWIFFQALGGEETDHLTAVSLDGTGGAFVAGTIGCHSGTACTSNISGFNISAPSEGASILGHISTGGVWTWVTQMNNSAASGGSSTPNDLAVGPNGHGYMTGELFGTVQFGSHNATANGTNAHDPFIASFTSNGNWRWTLVGGSAASDQGHGIDVGASERVIIAGYAAPNGHFGSHLVSGTGSTVAFIAASAPLDPDGDGVIAPADLCPKGDSGWTSSILTDYDGDGCRDATEDLDDDNDAILDAFDRCPLSQLNLTSTNDHDGDGCWDGEDMDDDGDGSPDGSDHCPKGRIPLANETWEDHDDDGCHDASEDLDDDGDGTNDSDDFCALGELNWTSSPSTDHDADGCHDDLEDDDDDSDGVFDAADSCPKGSVSWVSNSSTDLDQDGCLDHSEDLDDDGDGVLDHLDSCSDGMTGWRSTSSTDLDGDGCRDVDEDEDDDGDSVPDVRDQCPRQLVTGPDTDGDGCQDSIDGDADGDGTDDLSDQCTSGEVNWTSSPSTDHDDDGCHDDLEDNDDDSDGIFDAVDTCPKGSVGWISNSSTDHDQDGCLDHSEDLDDDGDGTLDDSDSCPDGMTGWRSTSSTDLDGDGCRDVDEDGDDDGDGINDLIDGCRLGQIGWISTPALDHDQDGCSDAEEDHDDDNDGIEDTNDSCSMGLVAWNASLTTDLDSDGCEDVSEDLDDDGDGLADIADPCPKNASSDCPQIPVSTTANQTDMTLNNTEQTNAAKEHDDGNLSTNASSNLAASTDGAAGKSPTLTYLAITMVSGVIGLGIGLALRSTRGTNEFQMNEESSASAGEMGQSANNARSTNAEVMHQMNIQVMNEWKDEHGYAWRRLSDGQDQWWDGSFWQNR